MGRRLLVVEQRFFLRGKGLMLTPGVVPLAGERIKPGDPVLVRRPDGSSLETTIQGTSTAVEFRSASQVFLLLELADKNQVPVGSEVWSAL
jgi:hypothetical protein